MTKKWTVLTLAIWTIALVLILTFYSIPKENSQEPLQVVKTLEKEKAALEQQKSDLDVQIYQLKTEAVQLTERLARREQTIKKLENALHEKITTITTMSAMDLQRYFAEFKTDSATHQP